MIKVGVTNKDEVQWRQTLWRHDERCVPTNAYDSGPEFHADPVREDGIREDPDAGQFEQHRGVTEPVSPGHIDRNGR